MAIFMLIFRTETNITNIYIYIHTHTHTYIVQTVTKQWISNSSTCIKICIRFNDLIHIKCVHQI